MQMWVEKTKLLQIEFIVTYTTVHFFLLAGLERKSTACNSVQMADTSFDWIRKLDMLKAHCPNICCSISTLKSSEKKYHKLLNVNVRLSLESDHHVQNIFLSCELSLQFMVKKMRRCNYFLTDIE